MSARNILLCDDTIVGERGDGEEQEGRWSKRGEERVCAGREKQRDIPTYREGECDGPVPGPWRTPLRVVLRGGAAWGVS